MSLPETSLSPNNTGQSSGKPLPVRMAEIDESLRAPAIFFFVWAVLWLLAGSVFGVVSAIKLHAP
ncbi:MAG: hypothetical protein LBV12_04420, partial [Puniceicoccales bacterium]|nr:hypothetical protein [Puniceicoccales bacterium]